MVTGIWGRVVHRISFGRFSGPAVMARRCAVLGWRTLWRGGLVAGLVIALSGTSVVASQLSHADPADDYADQYDRPVLPLPVVSPTPSNWAPKFPFPYDETRASVSNADINAE